VREIPFRVVLGHFEIDLWKISMADLILKDHHGEILARPFSV